MEESSSNDLVEIREELMVSPLGGNPSLRIAYFLKPLLKCIKREPPRDLLPNTLFSQTPTSKPEILPLRVRFNGWPNPQEEWKIWEEQLHSKYESVWRSAGIYEAIKASTYHMHRSNDLVLGLAQKWYSETNTFIFSWGEATITLEDIMFCGGYSVLGSPVFTPLEDEESKKMEDKLDQVRRKLTKTKAKKAAHLPWLRHFMEEKGELEHLAFLSLWLSRFVFPPIISKQVFSIAIHLARGIRIALAPAVLASIYRDLGLLKRGTDDAMKLVTSKDDENGISSTAIILTAPFKLVQIWAFERFPELQPKPDITEYNQPRLAKWHKVKMLQYGNVSLALGSAGKSFLWRPYIDCPKVYNEKDKWVCFNSDSHEDLDSFARCLRHSELVGLDCIKQYLPHRVSRQFGMDQDIPGRVARCKESSLIAWRNYNKPMNDTMLYVAAAAAASSSLKPSVTSQYSEWWEQSKLGWGKKSSKELLRSLSHRSFGNDETDRNVVLPSLVAADKSSESMSDGVEILAASENVVRGSKRAKEDAKSEDVIGKSKTAKEDRSGETDKTAVLPSSVATNITDVSKADGVEDLAKSENVFEVSKRAKEDKNGETDKTVFLPSSVEADKTYVSMGYGVENLEKSEDVVSGSKRAKEDENDAKDEEGKRIITCGVETAEFSDFETRIGELESVVAKLKAAKFGCRFGKFGAKARLS